MNHIGLFEGIGGFSLAARWMGWETIATCEINDFCNKILKHHFPTAQQHYDIKQTDFTIYRGKCDILTGGFPCQPFSLAGKRKGTEDDRHLFPEMLRAIREIQPTWIVGENVFGIINWDGGLVFEQVQADLEAEGYEVQSFILPAASVNAPHRRDRVWFVAYSRLFGQKKRQFESVGFEQLCKKSNASHSNSNGQQRSNEKHEINTSKRGQHALNDIKQIVTSNTTSERLERSLPRNTKLVTESIKKRIITYTNSRRQSCKEHRQTKSGQFTEKSIYGNWENFPTQYPVRWGNDGFSRKLVKYLTKEVLNEISKTSKENRIKNLPEMWERILQEEIWEQIRGFYSLESKEVLFQTMQLYSGERNSQDELSPFSENVSNPIMQYLSKYGQFRNSPQGQELEKQRQIKFGDSLSFLPHEIALAARRFETQLKKFDAWQRNESIKAYGNAIVPQVVLQIYKAIEQYNLKTK